MERSVTSRRRRLGILFTLPALAVYVVFLALPILATLALSLCKWSGYNLAQIKFIGFDNFAKVFTDRVFYRALLNTFIFVAVRVVFLNALGIAGALLIDSRAPGRHVLKTVVFIPCLLSSVIIGVMWSRIFDAYGILNMILEKLKIITSPILWLGDAGIALITILVASIWQWTGFNVLMYYAGLQNISAEIHEAARVDGAGYWQTVFRVTIPQLRPVVTMSVLWNLIGGFKVYDLVAVMTDAGPNCATEVLATYTYRHAFELNKMGTASVAAIVIVALCVIASIVRMKASQE
ncbi:MAG: sugar ABC transporter permease [Clostridiales bacterium]|nr:sugar ABC transporter permease [Clostridiales bacterium]